ncbi:B-box zinc finger family protein [Rhynchospora pubera]|uniref:B-box zinc finger family protein n=1 Tax=Rhynchospora pubera TaxID=906938 RepID=A0AAV8E1H0_9POAL|nr:B-box zinc finger family protein [Rhynchospora pubera]
MKVQCDVCGHEEASIFCCADEAALCDACDHKVHRANKLAGKHRRFALVRPASGDDSPNCDVCQEKRGYIFCQEDRAILCKDCDEPIHSANELTSKHNRFLLVGARLSVQPLSSSSTNSPLSKESEEPQAVAKDGNKKKELVKNNQEKASLVNGHIPVMKATPSVPMTTAACGGSSISEYLTKECPGWHVDDLFIDDAAAAVAAATMTGNLEGSGFDLPIWVPQPTDFITTATETTLMNFQTPVMGPKVVGPAIKSGRDCWSDDLFTVPQISPREADPPSKRARQSFWYY